MINILSGDEREPETECPVCIIIGNVACATASYVCVCFLWVVLVGCLMFVWPTKRDDNRMFQAHFVICVCSSAHMTLMTMPSRNMYAQTENRTHWHTTSDGILMIFFIHAHATIRKGYRTLSTMCTVHKAPYHICTHIWIGRLAVRSAIMGGAAGKCSSHRVARN